MTSTIVLSSLTLSTVCSRCVRQKVVLVNILAGFGAGNGAPIMKYVLSVAKSLHRAADVDCFLPRHEDDNRHYHNTGLLLDRKAARSRCFRRSRAPQHLLMCPFFPGKAGTREGPTA